MITMEIDSGVVAEQRSKRGGGVSKSDFFQTLPSLNSLTDFSFATLVLSYNLCSAIWKYFLWEALNDYLLGEHIL